MIQIKPADKFNIKGRGDVYSIDLKDQDINTLVALANYGLDRLREYGLYVAINGNPYVIDGIERFAQPMSIAATKPKVGLLVKRATTLNKSS